MAVETIWGENKPPLLQTKQAVLLRNSTNTKKIYKTAQDLSVCARNAAKHTVNPHTIRRVNGRGRARTPTATTRGRAGARVWTRLQTCLHGITGSHCFVKRLQQGVFRAV